MKKILIPTDFSDNSRNAANYAIELAKHIHAKLILFHAFHLPVAVPEVPMVWVSFEELEKTNRERLEDWAREIKAELGNHAEIECVTRVGFAVDEIETLINEEHMDMVIMGIRGDASPLGEILIGSNTIGVIRKASCPVLVISDEVKFKVPSKIVFATDFSEAVSEDSLAPLRELASTFHSEILITNVVKHTEVATYNQSVAGVKLDHSLENIPHSMYFPEGDNVVESINEFVDQHQADMLVMIPHHHTFLERIFVPSNTKRMAFHTHIPLLTLPEKL